MSDRESLEDQNDVVLAHQYRIAVETTPSQSQFRVLAIVFLEGTSSDPAESPFPLVRPLIHTRDGRCYVVGTNDEPGYIGGSICAERAALVQLRFLPHTQVSKIVITSDSHSPITPGMLCREFMAGHSQVPLDVKILLGGSLCSRCELDVSHAISVSKQLTEPCECRSGFHRFDVIDTTLRDLFPYHSCYSRLNVMDSVRKGEIFAAQSSYPHERCVPAKDTPSLLELPPVVRQQTLLRMAQAVSEGDSRTDLHPIQFGAVVLYSDGRTDTAYQKKALEYGSTLDAVSQLASRIQEKSTLPILLAQVDQYGIAHAPFANARAFLAEHAYESCLVLLHEFNDDGTISNLLQVPVSKLAPSAPDMGSLFAEQKRLLPKV